MPYIPATEIGAVFLVVGVLIGLSKLREAYPDLPQSIKPFLYVCAGLLLAGVGYQMLPDLFHHMFGSFGGGSATASTTSATGAPAAGAASPGAAGGGTPRPKTGTVTEVEYTITEPAKPAASVAAVQPAPEAVAPPKAPEPAAAPEPAPAAPEVADAKPESRGKKVIKSIGHVFHIGRHKDQDGE
jgi:hypothetical protein